MDEEPSLSPRLGFIAANLLVGIALIVLPGPAFIVIPLGLVILGSEFAWARWLVRRAKGMLAKVSGKRAENLTPEQKR